MTSKFMRAFLSLALLGLWSCETIYYVPTQQNVLKFKEKGDAYLAIGVDEYFKYSTIGYSITKNIGLLSEFKSISDNGSASGPHKNETFILG